jgi:hypothetical protein
MAKEQVLGFKPAPRLEQVDDEHSEQVQDRQHRSQSCDVLPSDANPKPDGIFGKDSLLK